MDQLITCLLEWRTRAARGARSSEQEGTPHAATRREGLWMWWLDCACLPVYSPACRLEGMFAFWGWLVGVSRSWCWWHSLGEGHVQAHPSPLLKEPGRRHHKNPWHVQGQAEPPIDRSDNPIDRSIGPQCQACKCRGRKQTPSKRGWLDSATTVVASAIHIGY